VPAWVGFSVACIQRDSTDTLIQSSHFVDVESEAQWSKGVGPRSCWKTMAEETLTLSVVHGLYPGFLREMPGKESHPRWKRKWARLPWYNVSQTFVAVQANFHRFGQCHLQMGTGGSEPSCMAVKPPAMVERASLERAATSQLWQNLVSSRCRL
jgi:ribonuclease I